MPRESRRFSLWVPLPVLQTLQERADTSKLGIATELREALVRGLHTAGQSPDPAEVKERLDQVELTATAALFACEQLIRFLVRHYPEGERKMLEVREAAAQKAEERLAELKERWDQEAQP